MDSKQALFEVVVEVDRIPLKHCSVERTNLQLICNHFDITMMLFSLTACPKQTSIMLLAHPPTLTQKQYLSTSFNKNLNVFSQDHNKPHHKNIYLHYYKQLLKQPQNKWPRPALHDTTAMERDIRRGRERERRRERENKKI